MAATAYHYTKESSSRRAVAMVLALASAVVLSPLYALSRSNNESSYEARWSHGPGFVLPMVLASLIIAIKTTSSSSSMQREGGVTELPYSDPSPSWVLKIGSSPWGLAGILMMLMLVLSWQDSAQHFFWR